MADEIQFDKDPIEVATKGQYTRAVCLDCGAEGNVRKMTCDNCGGPVPVIHGPVSSQTGIDLKADQLKTDPEFRAKTKKELFPQKETRQVENVMPENQTKTPPAEIRYVLYSPTRGVYLGKDIWSNDPEAKTVVKAITMAHLKLDKSGQVEGAVAHQCMPDLPDNYASKDAVANSGLPRW